MLSCSSVSIIDFSQRYSLLLMNFALSRFNFSFLFRVIHLFAHNIITFSNRYWPFARFNTSDCIYVYGRSLALRCRNAHTNLLTFKFSTLDMQSNEIRELQCEQIIQLFTGTMGASVNGCWNHLSAFTMHYKLTFNIFPFICSDPLALDAATKRKGEWMCNLLPLHTNRKRFCAIFYR